MNKITFGKTGLSVSTLGFGGAPIGFLQTDADRVAALLNTLLDAGVNFIDTAAASAGSEEMIGKLVASRRDQLVLVSKCGQPSADLPGEAWSESRILATVDRTLKRLHTDRLDVMLLHSCDLPTLKKGEALGALVKAKNAGKIKFAGYSGDNQAAAFAAALPDVAVIETSISIADQANIDHVLPVARKHNVGVIVKRPIANAAWRQPGDQHGLYASYAQVYHDRLRKMEITPADLGFSGPPQNAWPEIALRFTLAQPGIHVPIIGTTNPKSAVANIENCAKGPLPDDAVRKIRAAFRSAEKAAGEIWAGQQ